MTIKTPTSIKLGLALVGLLFSFQSLSAQGNGPRGSGPGSSLGASGTNGPKAPSAGQLPDNSHRDGTASVVDIVSHLTTRLTLTTAQQTQATRLVTQLQTATTAAQTTFTTAFDAILTSAQLAIYNAQHGPDLGGLLGRTTNTDDVVHAASRLTTLLTLTTVQSAQATTLLTQFQTSLVAAQISFTKAFEAILTTAQLAIYQTANSGEGAAPFGTGVDFATNYVKYLTSLLTLTATQQSAATADVVQLQAAITAANTSFQTGFQAILTTTQLADYQKTHGLSPDRLLDDNQTGAVAQFVSWLTTRLTLTTAQQTQTTTLVTQLFASLTTADTAFDTALESVLTTAQLAIYKASLDHPHGPH